MQGEDDSQLRTLVVGIDAGCEHVLNPYFEIGRLPNLRRLFEEGVGGTLESQIPPWTASAWPSLYTGTNPGKHGVFDFLTFDGYDWSVVNATHLDEPTLWELLNAKGYRSVVVNAPVTHPAPEIDGAILPGYVAPDDPAGHPEGILEDVRGALGEYEIYTPGIAGSGTDDEKVERLVSLTEMRGEAFQYLADRFDPEFGFVQFQQTDTIFHEFPGDRERAGVVYDAVDEQVGEILADCTPDNVVLVSDHGMDAYERRFRANDFLDEHGYIASKQGGEGMPTWVTEHEDAGDDVSLSETVLELAATVGVTSQRIARLLEHLRIRGVVEDVVPDSMIRAASEQVDFPRSTAYMRSHVECGVRINLEGREPSGVVPQEAYERVRRELITLLSSAETPDGDLVFEDVAPREEYFHGPNVEDAVDIVTVPNDFEYYMTTWLLGEVFETPDGPAWDHTREGVIAATGEAVDTGGSLDGAHIFDVAPTVLATMDEPATDRMDGDPLDIVDAVGRESYDVDERKAKAVANPDVERRLSNLGYLEE